jgi:hypothetical protein
MGQADFKDVLGPQCSRHHDLDNSRISFIVVCYSSMHGACLLRALPVIDLLVILFIIQALVGVSMVSNDQFFGGKALLMVDDFKCAGVIEWP